MKKIIEQIKRYRKKNKLSQEALSSKLGIARNTISRWESEFYSPSPIMLKYLKMEGVVK
jgi:transcriptional regulator with XRE-family HTH domain